MQLRKLSRSCKFGAAIDICPGKCGTVWRGSTAGSTTRLSVVQVRKSQAKPHLKDRSIRRQVRRGDTRVGGSAVGQRARTNLGVRVPDSVKFDSQECTVL